jgi:hypothetical protein
VKPVDERYHMSVEDLAGTRAAQASQRA